jgi:hypothetical protein
MVRKVWKKVLAPKGTRSWPTADYDGDKHASSPTGELPRDYKNSQGGGRMQILAASPGLAPPISTPATLTETLRVIDALALADVLGAS